jgi:3-hydroxyisobutyrate dehydrogenase-like beta-hydroxyacid dehydrogenase
VQKVGFIGLGNMGLPMAKNLIKAGYDTYIMSRSRGPIEEAIFLGAKEIPSPKKLIENVDILFTCLPNPQTNIEIYEGQDGILKGVSSGKIIIDLSTVKPDLSQHLKESIAAKGADFIDAPISGGTWSAEAGTLTIMCSGELHVFEKVYSVLKVMGEYVKYVGPTGTGSVIKLINNMLVGVHTIALIEAYELAQKSGVDPALLIDIIQKSSGYSRVMDWDTLIEDGKLKPKVRFSYLKKDVGLAVSYAKELDLQLELVEETEKIVDKSMK